MRTSVQITADAGSWPELVDFVTGAEALGVGDTLNERLDTLGRALDLAP